MLDREPPRRSRGNGEIDVELFAGDDLDAPREPRHVVAAQLEQVVAWLQGWRPFDVARDRTGYPVQPVDPAERRGRARNRPVVFGPDADPQRPRSLEPDLAAVEHCSPGQM